MKWLKKNSDVAEAYANGAENGRTKHFFIEGRVIYSYGTHFPIALRLEPGVYLFNKDGYSNTTARHKGHVRRALGDVKLILVSTERLHAAIDNNITHSAHLTLIALEEMNAVALPN